MRAPVAAYIKCLVAEMARAGKQHRDAVLVAGGDGLLVAYGAAGLDDGRHAVGRQRVHVIAERKNASEAQA